MLKRLLAVSVMIAAAVPASADTNYLLAFPVGSGGGELCASMAQDGGGFCDTLHLPVPGTSATAPVSFFFRIGTLSEIYENRHGDFVPWPWSRPAAQLTDQDFEDTRVIPVLANPCEGGAGTTLVNASCANNAEEGYAKPSLGGLLSIGSIRQLRPAVERGTGSPLNFGMHVTDRNGDVWMLE